MVFFDNIYVYQYIWYVIFNKYWSPRSVVTHHAKSFQIISDENCWQHGHQWTADLLSSAWQLPGHKPKTFHSLHVWCQNVTYNTRWGIWTQQHKDAVRVASLKRFVGHVGIQFVDYLMLYSSQMFWGSITCRGLDQSNAIAFYDVCVLTFCLCPLNSSLSQYRCRISWPVEELMVRRGTWKRTMITLWKWWTWVVWTKRKSSQRYKNEYGSILHTP